MKAIVIHQYGGPEVLLYEDYPDPVPGAGEVLVDVAATSINPFDVMRRSGMTKDFAPIQFPGIVGVDVAGTIRALGAGVTGFAVGDKVMAMTDRAYAERCVVRAAALVKVPAGLDLVEAAALPLVTTTGSQLISVGTQVAAGQRILVAGAVGNVGRSAVFAAKKRRAVVIAGVLGRQLADAKTMGADQVVAIDDDKALADLPQVDAVADTVGGKTADRLLGKVKPGGVFGSVVGGPTVPGNDPSVRIVKVFSKPDAGTLAETAKAAAEGKLSIPIGRKLPLKEAAAGQVAVKQGGAGKVLLIP